MNWLKKVRKWRWAYTGRKKIRYAILQAHQAHLPIRIILGAGHHRKEENGWICTDLPQFDITRAEHWKSLFQGVNIQAIVAEHVLEHLSYTEIKVALHHAAQYLEKGAVFRLAVPDKHNPDTLYKEGTKPGGKDIGAHDHKVFLGLEDFDQLTEAFYYHERGLEYFDPEGKFHEVPYTDENGRIVRSNKHRFTYPPIPAYSSLIVDLIRK